MAKQLQTKSQSQFGSRHLMAPYVKCCKKLEQLKLPKEGVPVLTQARKQSGGESYTK